MAEEQTSPDAAQPEARTASQPAPAERRAVPASPGDGPSDQRGVVKGIAAHISMSEGSPDPIKEKVTAEHITMTLNMAGEHDEREFQLLKQGEDRRDSNRWFGLAIFIIAVIAICWLCHALKDDKDLLKQVLTGVFSFAAGALGGYGFAHKQKP